MSDASLARKLGPPRPLRDEELAIIRKLLSQTGLVKRLLPELSRVLVQDMSDGGMGSIQFCRGRTTKGKRMFGSQIAEGLFHDSDSVPVSVTLNLDRSGDLFELDVWKVDFSPLIRYPDIDDFQIIHRDERGIVIQDS